MDKWLNNNNAIRVVSVLLALIIWAIVHLDTSSSPQTVTSNTDTKVIEAVPITVTGLDEERYILTAMEATVVRMVVEGSISSLLKASNDDYIVKLDLANAREGIQEIPLTYTLPSGLSLVEISPRSVMIQIEELETRTVEVEILTVGEPEAGYIIGDSVFTSEIGNVVEITMPKDDFSLLDKVAVVVDVTGANVPIENKRANIEAFDTQGNIMNNATFNPETLNVLTNITLPSKEVPVQLRYSGQLSNNLSVSTITTEVQAVKVYAKQEQLDLIEVFDGALVDLSKISQSGEIKVKLTTKEGIVKVEPSEISVKVEIEPSQARLIEQVPITVVGLSEGHQVVIQEAPDKHINVPVKGAPQIVSRVKNTDIVLTLDVTELTVGEHDVSLTAELPAYIVTDTDSGFSYTLKVQIVDQTALTEDENEEFIEATAPEAEEGTTSND